MSEQAALSLQQELEAAVAEADQARSAFLSELADTAASTLSRRPGLEGVQVGDVPEPALTVLTDRTLAADLRIAVVTQLAAQISRRDDYLQALLAIVADQDDDPGLRTAALDVLGSAAFQVARFRPYRQQYDDILRDLVADPVADLRETAVSILAIEHDPGVQQILQEGLRGDGPLPVDRPQAIALLAEDDHLDNLPWLQELFDSEAEGARQAAVRFMGSYPDAAPTLESVLLDQGEASDVRQQSAASLRFLDPQRFESAAMAIAVDATDDSDVRTACLSALQHFGDTDRVYGDAAFVQQVEAIGADESAPQVAEVARNLLEQTPNP